jgi:hypothetical protein
VSKKEDKLYNKFFEVVEDMYLNLYSENIPRKEIRERLMEDMGFMIDEMERFEREVGRKMTSRQKRKLR